MIPQILHQLDALKAKNPGSWRQVCQLVPYASVMRWRQRQRLGKPLCQSPGPKKLLPLDWTELHPLLCQLHHGRGRSRGTGELLKRFAGRLSRRQLRALVQDYRRDQLQTMKHLHWLHPGLAWSCDATQYGANGALIIPVQDLASRYRFRPLVSGRLDGRQIAAHLESLFRQHGPPLFLKRDNGSPFNHHAVDEVMGRFGVLPLNNPPHFPRYNGGMEKSIRDLKAALDQRLQSSAVVANHFALTVEVTVQELNHRPRRCLNGRTACAVFHDDAQRLRWSKHQRHTIFRLLLAQFGAIIGETKNSHHLTPATAWRVTVEAWLRRQWDVNGLAPLSNSEKKCCKCLVSAEGGNEDACQQAVLMVLASRQLYATTPPGEKDPFPGSKDEGGFCKQANKSGTFTGVNQDKYRYCMGEKCKKEPTQLEKKLWGIEISSAAKVCDGLPDLTVPAGSYYWWNPDKAPTNEKIMQWNIKIGNCTEIPTGCKSIKVYACDSQMKPEGQK